MSKSSKTTQDTPAIFNVPFSNKPRTLIEFVTQELDGSDYETGSVETAQATADNVAECLARLLEFLREQNIVTDAQVYKIVIGVDASRYHKD